MGWGVGFQSLHAGQYEGHTCSEFVWGSIWRSSGMRVVRVHAGVIAIVRYVHCLCQGNQSEGMWWEWRMWDAGFAKNADCDGIMVLVYVSEDKSSAFEGNGCGCGVAFAEEADWVRVEDHLG